MQEGNESSVRKVNKKVSNAKMNKSQNAPINSSSTSDNFTESPQNVRLETSESDEESVSEILLACLCLRPDLLESFPNEPEDDISTEEFPEDEESCESENEQEEDVSDEEDDESGDEDNSDDDSDATADEEHSTNVVSGATVSKFLLNADDDHPQYSKQARIDAILEAAAASKDKKGNPVLRSATAALEETAQTITRMRTERNDASPRDKTLLSRTLIAACTDNDVNAVRRLLVEGNNLNEATDDGDSLLSLACSAGYYELAQVLLAMSAQVEDRGQKNDCTPLMEAASAGHIEIIELLIRHGADVNAQSSTGNTPLMYACAGGHVEAVKVLLAHGANVEDHNENGHTPLMEAASAGHVAVAKILLEHGAGINTHSNEFKESALTLACYKGHLDMVRFLLEAGADQEHKTDEMHTALMEASMDGHVEVARLLLDSGAQVNMPTDSFESPLTLAACGGHVDLAMLLIERGANIEEVNDEGYTPLMEAAREGHEEMVSLLLTQGANINAQTEETQETALTLACCGGFLEVADYLIKHGADIEMGASTPLMEAAQEGHLELVKFLLENKADVHAQTQTGDTALTYACENGHTDVAEVLLYFGAELEHLSEGGRTPLMKACRAGHICTVKFLIQKGADVNRQTTNNDHTPLSLACAGGHQQVVELLLAHGADPYHKLKDNSTMLIEAAKGGHTGVVQLLLDYPTSIPPPQQQQPGIYIPTPMSHQAAAASQLNMNKLSQQQLKMLQQQQQHQFMVAPVAPPGLHEVAEVIHSNIRLQEPPGIFPQSEMLQNQNFIIDPNVMSAAVQQQQQQQQHAATESIMTQMKILQSTGFKDGLAYGLTKGQSAVTQMINQQQQQQNNNTNNMNMTSCSTQQQPPHQTMITNNLSTCMPSSSTTSTASIAKTSSTNKQKNISRKKCSSTTVAPTVSNEQAIERVVGEEDTALQIRGSLDKLDNTLQKNIQFINDSGPPPTLLPSANLLPYVDITTAAQNKGINNATSSNNQMQATPQTGKSQITAKSEVSQSTAISDRPKAIPKNSRKHQQAQQQQQQQQQAQSVLSTAESGKSYPQEILANKIESELAATKSDATSEVPPPKPMPVPEIASCSSSSSSSVQSITAAAAALSLDEKEKSAAAASMLMSSDGAGNASGSNARTACSLVDFEAFQKMPLNNLSNRSAHWDPKVFRKIAQLIDPPKSPPETPEMRSNSPDDKRFDANDLTNQELKVLLEEAISYRRNAKGKNEGQLVDEGLEKTLATFRSMNPEDFVCDGTYSSLDESLDSFNPDDVVTGDDVGPIYNYEWVDEVMQALNVSPDISNAFHEIAANINNQDLEQYANIFGLKQICNTKWATPHWPSQHHHPMTSEGSSPTNEHDENLILGEGDDELKHHVDESNLLMIDQATGYPPQFTMEQLQLLSQLQQQHPLLQIDQQTAQSILMPPVPPPPIISQHALQQHQMKSLADAQQQTKFVFNVDNSGVGNVISGDKASQSLQLLFQLPTDQQQQIVNQQQQKVVVPEMNQKVQQTTQTMPSATGTSMQLPPTALQSGFMNFQLQQQQQQQQQTGIQQQPQKMHQMPQFINKTNYQQQQVQVATQTQPHQHHHPAAESLPHATPTSNNAGKSVVSTVKKSAIGESKKRTDKSRYPNRQSASNQNQYHQYDQQLQYANVPGSTSTGTTVDRSIEIDSETDSNHDTALTLACAGGHEELVELLLKRKANIEHRDKKGFTPLILAATAGHEKVVEILITQGHADLEAQSERTKDTPLSLACSGGRYEVVELLLKYNANKEHRNVSDYTPLSLAASGGYVNIIKLLLNNGAEINSRTGSKLGISPLMLAAMNGHTAAVRLLLDMGSDINAQIETNRNTALTLACFQGRHEVVSLLLDRKANVEHRAKTGLTPLMEAASGGYIEVGRVLLDKSADVNAAPVPSSRDTALTIAADKGHLKFVELLLSRGAAVEVKNKKGNSPLWLAANGGHLGVVEALYNAKADIDSQDNRKVSCLMTAFRKGHVKVVKWMVNHVTQFPSDQEMVRQISVVDKEVVDKCQECVKIIRAAKETQAKKAKQNADILLKELDMEKSREDARKAAAAKRRERKNRRKREKKEAQRKANETTTSNDKSSSSQQAKGKNNQKRPEEPLDSESEEEEEEEEEIEEDDEVEVEIVPDKEELDSGIDQGSCSSSDAKGAVSVPPTSKSTNDAQNHQQSKNQKSNNNSKNNNNNNNNNNNRKSNTTPALVKNNSKSSSSTVSNRSSSSPVPVTKPIEVVKNNRNEDSKRNQRDQKSQRCADLTIKSTLVKPTEKENVAPASKSRTTIVESKSYENSSRSANARKSFVISSGNSRMTTNTSSSNGADDYEIDYFKPTTMITSTSNSKPKTTTSPTKAPSAIMTMSNSAPNSASKLHQQQQPREEEWKEVGKKPASTTSSTNLGTSNEIGCKKIQVPLNAISRVIGRGGSNINAIRAATGAHIEVEKQGKTQGDRSITIKGVPEATKQAHNLISTLIKDPDADILSMLPRNNFPQSSSSASSVTTSSVAPTAAVISSSSSVVVTAATAATTRSSSSNNIISPSSIASINNGTSVWEKSRDVIPTIANPVKPAYAIQSQSKPISSVSSSNTNNNNNNNIIKATTPTQLNNNNNSKTPRSVAKNLFAPTNSDVMRPTPTSTAPSKIFMQDSSKKGIMVASNGPPPQSGAKSSNSSANTTFASKLSGNEEIAPFTNHPSSSAISNSSTTTLTRSITPIGPPTRNYNASPHSSHIVNTLDLSTPYSTNDISNQFQSKLGELHVSGLEYSLFDMGGSGGKWNHNEQANVFSHPLSVVGEVFGEPPLQVDASKAPGYRGAGANASINSPVSSKTSSNSATPPSTILASQAPTSTAQSQASGNYGDMSVLPGIKPIGSGSSQRQQQQQQQQSQHQQQSSFNRSPGGSVFSDAGNYNQSVDSSSFSRQMNFNMNPTAMPSRLNPKASAFSSTTVGSKMNNSQYGQSSFMGSSAGSNSHNNNFMKSPGSQQQQQQQQSSAGYQRGIPNSSTSSSSSSRWFGDLGSSFSNHSNMNVMNDFIPSSPSMSPNNNNNGPNLSALSMDDSRKAPPPIGTERQNFNKYGSSNNCYQYPDMDFGMSSSQMNMPPPSSWMDNKSQQQWQMQQSNVPIVPRTNPYDTSISDYNNMTADIFQQQYPMDHQSGYMRNGGGASAGPYLQNLYMNDLPNDLQQTSYEKQPSWASKWTQ